MVHLKLGMTSIEVKIYFTHLFKPEWQTWCQVATGVERSFLIPIPKNGSLKNVQTTKQLHSSPMLVRLCLKSCMLGFSIMCTKNLQMFKLGLEKAEEPETKLATFAESQR